MIKRSLFAALLAALITSLFQTSAWAHAAYKDSSPGKDATVTSPPNEVWVDFTEMIEDGNVSVYDPCGEQVDHGDDEKNLTNDRITTATHADKAGTYTVQWSVLGADGHPTKGEFTFTSSNGESCPQDEPARPTESRDRTRRQQPGTNVDEDPADSTAQRASRPGAKQEDSQRSGSEAQTKDRARKQGSNKPLALSQSQEAPEPASDKGIWDGIPMGDFFTGLAVAAVIGAAGGRIYAGIIGPRR
jgi:methionine-rich copper-binding protein CopC